MSAANERQVNTKYNTKAFSSFHAIFPIHLRASLNKQNQQQLICLYSGYVIC